MNFKTYADLIGYPEIKVTYNGATHWRMEHRRFSHDEIVAIATRINRSYDLVAEVLTSAGFVIEWNPPSQPTGDKR